MRYEKFITRKMVQDNPDTLFVFGDNMLQQGLAGQAKEMRGEPNAVGIVTKMRPSMAPDAFLNDDCYYQVILRIESAFLRLIIHKLKGGEVVWPKDGVGTGLADLKRRAPVIWKRIEGYRKVLESMK